MKNYMKKSAFLKKSRFILFLFCFLPSMAFAQGLIKGYVTAFCIDQVVESARRSVQFFIISDKYREIGERINREPHRGCTVIDAQGFYSGKDVKMLFVLAKRRQSDMIFRIINEVDPHAFVSQSAVIGVYGEGFDRFKVRTKKATT